MDVPRGWSDGESVCIDGSMRPFLLNVPLSYTPEKAYPVVINLHGAISRSDFKVVGRIPNLEGPWGQGVKEGKYIFVAPISNQKAPWWSECGAHHVLSVLHYIKSVYNIDENRVVCMGYSDGGSGVYYMAANHSTPFAAFICMSAWLPAVEAGEANFFIGNLVNKPIYIIHGERDRLFPVSDVKEHVNTMRNAGVDLVFRVYEHASHSAPTYWEKARPDAIEFTTRAVRDPFPQKLHWECSNTSHGRCHWIQINKISDNVRSGRIHASRFENTIEVSTQGVDKFTLLISRDMINVFKALEVNTNGHKSFSGLVYPNPIFTKAQEVEDHDRTMVFWSYIEVDLTLR